MGVCILFTRFINTRFHKFQFFINDVFKFLSYNAFLIEKLTKHK